MSETVQKYYDEDPALEWARLERNPFEFEITAAMLDRYIKPGEKILDIGGGPGRYSLYLSKKGCDVTLVDLSANNVKFAIAEAAKQGLNIAAYQGDATDMSGIEGVYDHVLLMGPLYHLLEDKQRETAVNQALSKLKSGGKLFASFILMFSGMIFMMKYAPDAIARQSEAEFVDAAVRDESFGGMGFTEAFFTRLGDIEPFMARFPLKKLNLFAQEGILAPCEDIILAAPREIRDRWVEAAKQMCEREDLIGFSEHVMYIGEKL